MDDPPLRFREPMHCEAGRFIIRPDARFSVMFRRTKHPIGITETVDIRSPQTLDLARDPSLGCWPGALLTFHTLDQCGCYTQHHANEIYLSILSNPSTALWITFWIVTQAYKTGDTPKNVYYLASDCDLCRAMNVNPSTPLHIIADPGGWLSRTMSTWREKCRCPE